MDAGEILDSYLDVFGREKAIDTDTRRALELALGNPARRKARSAGGPKAGRCYLPPLLESGGRVWGFSVQLYSLRSERNWGCGDFGDLRALVELSAKLGASLVGVNPLHAGDGSPYSPSSRYAINWRYLDIEAIPEYAASRKARALVSSFQGRLGQLREAELVDNAEVGRLKREVLEALFKESSFRGQTGDYALFEALREKFGAPWQSWPEPYRNPRSSQVRAFKKKNARRVRFHEFVQCHARNQLNAVQARAKALGMPIGLYVDLALGADAGGAEVWADQKSFALDVSCGAPPDDFNPKGQDWGLPPFSPRALRASRGAQFGALLRANMPKGGALRLDHVMALMRLYWIPRGAKPTKGGYVSYPFRELLSVVAQESRRASCLVVGEDLGTVAEELRTALHKAAVLSYRPLYFQKEASGEYSAPASYPRQALVCVSTHDLPTWRGFREAHDLELRRKAGLAVDPQAEAQARAADREKLERALRREGLDPSARSAHAFVGRTPCMLAAIQPEDVLERLEQANLPGSIDEHPNWRRKLPLALERWEADRRFAEAAQAMRERAWPRSGFERTPACAPVATYRMQFHRGFRFRDAIALVPYLARLGVSHLYASPFLKARPGSTHGYDVIDPQRINPEIGTQTELERLLKALRKHGMGLVMDVVPNHMGVLQGDNPWWQDVLEKGRSSRYAKYFDIDWTNRKVLLPVLGKHYGEALDAGEIRLVKEGGRWMIAYYDQRFPVKGTVKPTKDPLELHRLLERQHYRLAFWRVAADEINYRRFFEIADLAALRAEDQDVFRDTHALIAKLARRDGVDGARVDHPDGLADPRRYLERLGKLFGRAPWVLVEKILGDHEALPEDWPVHGTTGYRFANVLTGVFIDASAEARFDRVYRRFTGEQRSFEEIARESRFLIMATTLAGDLHVLGARLSRIADGNRRTRDYTESGLRKALAEIAAAFPVYRSYVSARGVSDLDRRYIDWAVRAARRASRIADPGVFEFVRSVLTLDAAPPSGPRREEMLRFAMRFQQFTAPVVAKGVEDTAFYRYTRLIPLNEVGGEPGRFGLSLKAFHAAAEDRMRRWPWTMLGSSTHDTKRSEDARARLGVLSEVASAWRLALRRWSLLNRSKRTEADGRSLPSRGDEYHFYQALIAIWPGESMHDLRERLAAYMLKAVREAKQHSSWINPDQEYEAALERFVAESLKNELFLRDVREVMPRLEHLGRLVSLSQALLKVASPGVPDYYQGTETFDFSLVDPDNRRPVDYKLLASDRKDPKQHIIRKGLEVRRKLPHLFHDAQYMPLYADSGMEEKVIAFALQRGADCVIAVAPRLFASMIDGKNMWQGARLALPEGGYEDVLTGKRLRGGATPVAEILAEFPVALLVSRP